MKFLRSKFIFISIIVFFTSCKTQENKETDSKISSKIYHQLQEALTDCIVNDIFSPPVAARIYAYPNLAAYYILSEDTGRDFFLKLNQFKTDSLPEPENLNRELASLIAFIEVAKKFVFTDVQLAESLDGLRKRTSKNEFQKSKEYALRVAEVILSYANNDGYIKTRTYPKTNLKPSSGKWMPTPPDYMDAIEPHWNKIRPFFLDSSDQFVPIPPPDFGLEKHSNFRKELDSLYLLTKEIKQEEIEVAKFWDCNPYVALHQGHYMEGIKKITPGGHWMGITGLSCRKAKLSLKETCYAYTVVSSSLHDAFISCWDEKYRSMLIRPETAINLYIDPEWKPILTTPPFPEYTSGHSVISATSSIVLTDIFGSDFKFIDSTELKYGLPVREFKSFQEAAEEAAVSRIYGGIHYKSAVDNGLDQGYKIGKFISEKIST